MPRLKVVVPDDEPDHAGDVRAEELRLLEAMLFASSEPLDEKSLAATVLASSFASSLELVREGVMEMHQQGAFAPLYVRKRQASGNGVSDTGGVAAPPADGKG